MAETIILHSTVDGRQILIGKTFIIRAEPDTETGGSILTVKLDNTKSVPYFVKETIPEIQDLLDKS